MLLLLSAISCLPARGERRQASNGVSYHCALELASDLLADLFTFFSPPTLYFPFFVLTAPDAALPMKPCYEEAQAERGVCDAIDASFWCWCVAGAVGIQ